MKSHTSTLVALSILVLSLTAFNSAANENAISLYAGQEKRQIKALSAKDIDDLLNGRGWGFAKAAELNGMPGPAHIIEMAKKIGLNKEQNSAIQVLFKRMKTKAIALGSQMVKFERELDQMFADKSVTPDSLGNQLARISSIRGKLRQVHLETHLQTPSILTRHQIVTYNKLRGYSKVSGHTGHH
jgi:Spy/CpxP family protein refolding chaperone